jgi:hypothetical protein
MTDPEVAALLQAVRAAIDAGETLAARFVIPTVAGTYRVACADLQAAGENDLGIPPRAFAYGAVGMLLAALGGQRCYVTEPAMSAAPPRPLHDPDALSPDAVRQGAGPAPQAAAVVSVFAKGLLEVHAQPYVRDHDGQLVWGEPALRSTTEPGGLGSAVPLWRAVNRDPSPLPPPDQLIEDMRDSGFVIEVER